MPRGRPRKTPLIPQQMAEATQMAQTSKTPLSQSSTSSLVTPSIQHVGVEKEHIMKTLFDNEREKLPIIETVGMMKVPGTSTYVSFVMKTQGREVLNIEVEEPNLYLIAADSTKIALQSRVLDPHADL